METLDLFAGEETTRHDEAVTAARVRAEELQRHYWEVCWGWQGPVAGEFCQIDTVIVDLADGGSIYAYMERVRLIELGADGRWLAEVAMSEVRSEPWFKDGTRVLLGICDIWPPIRDLRSKREAA